MTHITIERENDTRLKSTLWRFYYMERTHTLVLDVYSELARPTRRHKYVSGLQYVRLDSRNSNCPAPPIPEDVETDARFRFNQRLRVSV